MPVTRDIFLICYSLWLGQRVSRVSCIGTRIFFRFRFTNRLWFEMMCTWRWILCHLSLLLLFCSCVWICPAKAGLFSKANMRELTFVEGCVTLYIKFSASQNLSVHCWKNSSFTAVYCVTVYFQHLKIWVHCWKNSSFTVVWIWTAGCADLACNNDK